MRSLQASPCFSSCYPQQEGALGKLRKGKGGGGDFLEGSTLPINTDIVNVCEAKNGRPVSRSEFGSSLQSDATAQGQTRMSGCIMSKNSMTPISLFADMLPFISCD